MKKLIGIILIAASLAACNNKYKASSNENANSLKMMKDSLRLDSFKRAEVAKTEAKKAAAARPVIVNHYSTTQAAAAPVEHKRGWSSAAKGALIGGVAGAGAGALIDRKTGRGAIVGAAAGAGAGYLIGRGKDKKDGTAN
jgi:uncharacterized protein YcfJ